MRTYSTDNSQARRGATTPVKNLRPQTTRSASLLRPAAAALTPPEVARLQRVVGNQALPNVLLRAPLSPVHPAPKRTPPSRPLDYDRNPRTFKPVPRDLTLEKAKARLDEKVADRKIASYDVFGVPEGSHAQIFLLARIDDLADPARWSTETDIVTDIDWPPPDGSPVRKGRVTVRIDARGAAIAELIATGPVPAPAQTTIADATARLTGPEFRFASVSGWSDVADISDVVAALELLKSRAPQSLSALEGVDLIRVPTLPDDRAGEFDRGTNVAVGDPADTKPYLKLADRAFAYNNRQFFGGGGGPREPTVPASFFTILHEVGHAVETEQFRRARAEVVTGRTALDAAGRAVDEYEVTSAAELQNARRRSPKAFANVRKRVNATKKRLIAAQDDASRRHTLASEAFTATRDPVTGRRKMVQKFVTLVTTNNIRPFTEYSAKNWPHSPEEFYAEAFALWLADPTFMRTNYPVVYDFFQGGDYLR